MAAAPAPVDLGTAGIPSSSSAADPTHTEIPAHYIENDFGHNASEAGMGILEGLHELSWDTAKAAALDGLTLGGYSFFSTARDVGRAAFKAWTTGRWAGFSENVIDIANHRLNPLYTIGERSFFAYLSGQSHDWRGAFRHGTIAAVLTILAVVTAGKGIANALKKGNGAAGLGAVEDAAAPKGGTYKLVDPETGQVRRTGRTNNLDRRQAEHRQHSETKGLDFEVDKETDSYPAQRGREQRLYDMHPEADLNRNRPIDPRNPNREHYLKEGDKL